MISVMPPAEVRLGRRLAVSGSACMRRQIVSGEAVSQATRPCRAMAARFSGRITAPPPTASTARSCAASSATTCDLPIAKRGLAVLGENLGDRLAGQLLDLAHRHRTRASPAEPASSRATVALARAAIADEDEVHGEKARGWRPEAGGRKT